VVHVFAELPALVKLAPLSDWLCRMENQICDGDCIGRFGRRD
jgi:hypothetical protein